METEYNEPYEPIEEPTLFRRAMPLGGEELRKAIEECGKPTMTIADGHICIPIPNAIKPVHSYDIALKRISSPLKLLSWVCHLSGKPWMDGDRLEEFIRLAAKEKGMNLPYSL